MSGRGNVLVGEMFGHGSLRRGSVWSGKCPFGEMSIGEVSVYRFKQLLLNFTGIFEI